MNWTNVTTFNDVLVGANNQAPFWTGILFMLWAVLIITFLPFGTSIAFIGGSFIAFVLGLMLAYMGLVAFKYVLALLALVIIIVIVDLIFAKKE